MGVSTNWFGWVIVMRTVISYVLCTVLFLAACWLIKLVITGISPHFGYGFASGAFVTVLLVFIAEKLGYKEPRY
jgi:hypothetical protein